MLRVSRLFRVAGIAARRFGSSAVCCRLPQSGVFAWVVSVSFRGRFGAYACAWFCGVLSLSRFFRLVRWSRCGASVAVVSVACGVPHVRS
jgi:hypothetical protein